MRTLLKFTLAAAILLGGVVGFYYLDRRGKARRNGEEYSVVQLPGDLVESVAGLMKRDEEPGPEPEAAVPEPEGEDGGDDESRRVPENEPEVEEQKAPVEEPAAPPLDHWSRGRKLFQAGDYRAAQRAFDAAGSQPRARHPDDRDRALLFEVLLADVQPGSALDDLPVARIALARGEPFMAALLSETDEEISFKKDDGIGARVKKTELRSLRIARTEAQLTALAENEYQRRHVGLSGAADYYELARFCQMHNLTSHLTYLLESALDRGKGPGMEDALLLAYERARKSGSPARAAKVVGLFRTFFPRSEHLAEVAPARPTGPAVAASHRREPRGEVGAAPPSGIGGTGSRDLSRSIDKELNALLMKADEFRGEANDHYEKALPGSPNAKTHRKKAIDLYDKAIALYEKAEEKWGVSLDRTFKDLLQRRYQLMKDTPVR